MHGLSIEYPISKGRVFLLIGATGWGSALYELVYWDSINKRRIVLNKKTIRYETAVQGRDVIGNQKDFYHAYCEGTLNILPLLPDFLSKGEVKYGTQHRAGNMLFAGARVTMKSGQTIDVPSANSDPFMLSGYYVKCIPNGLSCTQDYYTDKQCTNLIAHMVSTGSFIFDGERPSQTRVKAVRTGHQYAPTRFDGRNNKDYNDPSVIGAFAIELQSFDPKTVVDAFYKAVPSISFGKIPSHLVPSNLTDRIYSQLIIPNVNNIENLAGIKEMKSFIPKLKKILLRHDIKSVAELYLIWKYEYSTTMMDIKAYMTYIQQLQSRSGSGRQMIHLSASEGNKITHYTISFPTYTSSFLEQCGLSFNSANVWDTLPLSFVVDWFIGIGDTLQRLHEENILTEIKVNYCTASSTTTEQVVLMEGPFKGSGVTRVVYNRTTSSYFPTPDVDVVFKNPIRHIFDGSALVVANKRR